MTIGIDISPLQGPHRMRGIGFTIINLINHLPKDIRQKYKFVFFKFPEAESANDPFTILDTTDLNYEVRTIRHRRRLTRKWPGKLYLINSILNQLIELRDAYFGDSRIGSLRDIDVFLQTDQSQSLPHIGRTKKALIIYDIIPYALEWEYLWSYKTARQVHGFSRKAALRCKARRWLYGHKLKVNISRAKILIAISEQTKHDFVTLLSAPSRKIHVVPLGVTVPNNTNDLTIPKKQYIKSGWGYVSKAINLDPEVPFLLYVGGADKRRKLQDLVTAFNHLRAKGHNLKLILVGDCMQGPENIATEEIQTALKESSYLDDIIFMGFIDGNHRDWLYFHALAFIFPSRYEGFGLPVLEAMAHSCPVICYENKAVFEVAGNAPLYVNNSLELTNSVETLLQAKPNKLETLRHRGLVQANKYTWPATSAAMILAITKSA